MPKLVTFGETPLRLSAPDSERLETAERAALYADGEESNVAVAATCLGTDCTWLSKLPDTPIGRRIAADVRRHGVETDVTWAEDGRVGVQYHETGATPRPERRWHDRDGTAAASVTPGEIPMEQVQSADVVFSGVATPALSESTAETTEAMLRASAGSGATTAVDLDYEPDRHDPDFLGKLLPRLFRHVDVFFVNEDDAGTVLDVSGKPRDVANTLVAEYDLEMVVVTRSAYGAVVMHDAPGTSVIHERDTVDTEDVDPTGTREAFVGGFLSTLIGEGDAAEALTYGVATAALARTVPGPLVTAEATEVEAVADRVSAQSR